MKQFPLVVSKRPSDARIFFACLLGFLLLVSTSPLHAQWNLVWSDEFDGAAGSAPSSANWGYDTGGGGFGNGELEFYCAAGENTAPCSAANPNIYLDGNGHLVIKAMKNGGQWTSGRMKTQGKHQFTFGRVEANIQLPEGAGLWPAFWMLGANIGAVGWPACGEQDILEWVQSYGGTKTSSHIHGPGYSGGAAIGGDFTFPNGGVITTFHTYGNVWSNNEIQFYRDDWQTPFQTITSARAPGKWVFNAPMFILLNLAIGGGGFPGTTNASTPNPAFMIVDYVRVYEPGSGGGNPTPTPTPTPTLPPPPPACSGVCIDSGSTTGASPFVADEDFLGGATINHANTIDLSKVTNPAPAAVYQSARIDNFTYTIPGFTAGSTHTIRLHFAETFFGTAGSRTFNVSINGTQVLTDFDIFKAAGGKNIANIQQFTENANSNGDYVIQFTSVVNNSLVSGIEID